MMGENSKIEWCDNTWNPWVGCAKVSAGCAHCYAERDFDKRRGFAKWGPGGTRVITSEANWRKPLRWDREARAAGVRRKVFCASLADVFELWEGAIGGDSRCLADLDDIRENLWTIIRGTPNLDWLLLTKRPENVRTMVPPAWLDDWPKNVWLGTSIENQSTADERMLHLLRIPAAVRFLSCEPLLGPIVLHPGMPRHRLKRPGPIHWVIAGGESGPEARPSHPNWFRSIRNECQAAGVPFFFKQWGEWLGGDAFINDGEIDFQGQNGPVYQITPDNTRTFFDWGPDENESAAALRVGTKAAGRLLDGREWNEFPGGAA
jgi:protein gp37